MADRLHHHPRRDSRAPRAYLNPPGPSPQTPADLAATRPAHSCPKPAATHLRRPLPRRSRPEHRQPRPTSPPTRAVTLESPAETRKTGSPSQRIGDFRLRPRQANRRAPAPARTPGHARLPAAAASIAKDHASRDRVWCVLRPLDVAKARRLSIIVRAMQSSGNGRSCRSASVDWVVSAACRADDLRQACLLAPRARVVPLTA